jgi:MFS family permease
VAGGVVVVLFAGLLNAGGRSSQGPTLSSLISRAADERMQGTVFGFFHMLGSLGRVIGPMIATALYIHHPTAPFMLAACMMIVIATWTMMLRAGQEKAAAPVAA